MKTNFEPTNEYYHRILQTQDATLRVQLYQDLLVKPWKPMMEMMGRFGADTSNPLGGARAWGWLLPDQTEQMFKILNKLEAADAWTTGREALAEAAARFDPYQERIPFDCITGWLALGDPARSNPFERGYSGATDWTRPWFIGQYWEPDAANLYRLPALVAHEMHHLIRNRLFPWGPQISVADYIVVEGTAECFATTIFGEDKLSQFISEFDPHELEQARRLIGKALDATGFDVIRGYIFGDALAERSGFQPVGGMPTFGGYAVGYSVVQAFLKHNGMSIEETTFLPAQEIVQGSGFFG
jgi:uncharacterized protein YjaZ